MTVLLSLDRSTDQVMTGTAGVESSAWMPPRIESEDEFDPDADDELDDIDDVKPKGGEKDADGLWKVVPKNVGAIITAFAKAHKNKPIAERPCWNRVFKSGGCTKQSCPFSH